ncbi:hypothetical protein U1Q18_001865 [Sarracenia purpurea var. burkii]
MVSFLGRREGFAKGAFNGGDLIDDGEGFLGGPVGLMHVGHQVGHNWMLGSVIPNWMIRLADQVGCSAVALFNIRFSFNKGVCVAHQRATGYLAICRGSSAQADAKLQVGNRSLTFEGALGGNIGAVVVMNGGGFAGGRGSARSVSHRFEAFLLFFFVIPRVTS